MALEDNDNEDNVKKRIEESQLKKLELEVRSLERKEGEETQTTKPRGEKLQLELDNLRWQTGRIYRLSQFAVIFSVLATIVTIFATTYGIWSSYKKDIENKRKELTQRTDTLYRSEIEKLIQYPIEPKTTISEAVFLMRDLEDVVNNSYEDAQKLKRQKEEVGLLLTQLMASPDFDLSVTRNIEFDRKALRHSQFYSDYLTDNPNYNRDILSKYKSVLVALHDEDPNYSVVPDENKEEVFLEKSADGKVTKKQEKFFQYIYIYYAYKAHVALLNDTIAKNPDKSAEAEVYLGLSFCWFYDATKNEGLIRKIYGGTPEMVEWRWQQCFK
jgi:hypothetical protein